MKIKLNNKEILANVKEKTQQGIYMIERSVYRLMLKALGLVSNYSVYMPILNSQSGTSISPDGRYIISWSWKGLIYLIDMGCLGAPIVISFVADISHPWGAHFSKDMQQIIITYEFGKRTILSAVHAEGFHRRKFPIIQDWISDVPHAPPHNIVEFLSQTSSAYWKHVDNSKNKDRWTFPTPPSTELDCDWGQWVSFHGERYLDIPRDTCELDG